MTGETRYPRRYCFCKYWQRLPLEISSRPYRLHDVTSHKHQSHYHPCRNLASYNSSCFETQSLHKLSTFYICLFSCVDGELEVVQFYNQKFDHFSCCKF